MFFTCYNCRIFVGAAYVINSFLFLYEAACSTDFKVLIISRATESEREKNREKKTNNDTSKKNTQPFFHGYRHFNRTKGIHCLFSCLFIVFFLLLFHIIIHIPLFHPSIDLNNWSRHCVQWNIYTSSKLKLTLNLINFLITIKSIFLLFHHSVSQSDRVSIIVLFFFSSLKLLDATEFFMEFVINSTNYHCEVLLNHQPHNCFA